MFYPKFHCEINPIEMLWGYTKYCEYMHIIFHYVVTETSTGFRAASDGKFTMAKLLVPQCLDMADIPTIRHFFFASLGIIWMHIGTCCMLLFVITI